MAVVDTGPGLPTKCLSNLVFLAIWFFWQNFVSDDERAVFYAHYQSFKNYLTPQLKSKHLRQFDREFWAPSACTKSMSVLEIGCGTGLFLAYPREKGVSEFLGIDRDSHLRGYLPQGLEDHFIEGDIQTFLEAENEGRHFDRIALFDVLEHFTPIEGLGLLTGLKKILRPGGRVIIRVPNVSSPWGLQYQYGDLTHRTAFTPESLRQLAQSAGFDCLVCLPQRQRHFWQNLCEDGFQWLLRRILSTSPEIWSAKFIAVIKVK